MNIRQYVSCHMLLLVGCLTPGNLKRTQGRAEQAVTTMEKYKMLHVHFVKSFAQSIKPHQIVSSRAQLIFCLRSQKIIVSLKYTKSLYYYFNFFVAFLVPNFVSISNLVPLLNLIARLLALSCQQKDQSNRINFQMNHIVKQVLHIVNIDNYKRYEPQSKLTSHFGKKFQKKEINQNYFLL